MSDSDRKFMEKITEIVVNNLSDTEFSIDILCREMAMSRTLLYGRLKSLTGKAPQEFIRILYLERAADLLRQGMSVTDVADATGFVNVKYFSTIFKKHFGVQPSKFNEKEKNANK
jgi:AraC-like DNA-binding protein